MADLVGNQRIIGQRISRLVVSLKKRGKANSSMGVLQAGLETLQELWADYREGDAALRTAAETDPKMREDPYLTADEYDDVQQVFIVQFGLLLDMISELQASATVNEASNPNATAAEASSPRSLAVLPKKALSTFNGQYKDSPSFRDVGSSLSIEDTSPSPVERIHYTKAGVKGSAASLLKNIATTAENFPVVCDEMEGLFENCHPLAQQEEQRYPRGSQAVLKDICTDDVLTGADSPPEARLNQQEVRELPMAGGIPLRKWADNARELLEEPSNDEPKEIVEWDSPTSHRALGIRCLPSSDCFQVSAFTSTRNTGCAKRAELNGTAQLFEPLGLLAPFTIIAKVLKPSQWVLPIDWDAPLRNHEELIEQMVHQQLPARQPVRLPRWLEPSGPNQAPDIHGGADAPESAYYAGEYSRTLNDEGSAILSPMVTESRVATLKRASRPRLELCTAFLSARLVEHAHTVLDLLDFGARPTGFNSKLPSVELWGRGPEWPYLSGHPPAAMDQEASDEVTEPTVHFVSCRLEGSSYPLTERFSNLTRILRVLAWCRRWIPGNKHGESTLTAADVHASQLTLLLLEQAAHVAAEIRALRKSQPVQGKSRGFNFSPFLYLAGVLLVEGRLQVSNLAYDRKHPAMLPVDSQCARVRVDVAHKRCLHGGTLRTPATLRPECWKLKDRPMVNACILHCTASIRWKVQTALPKMGNLPLNRVTPCRPFFRSGIDYAGPIQLRADRGRGQHTSKGYIASFMCLPTKAAHLEAASDGSTDTFLSDLLQFTARRGRCAELYLDGGRNFIGAHHELRTLLREPVTQMGGPFAATSREDITWRIHPSSPSHFGGIRGTGVQPVEHPLRRIIGEPLPNFEELTTLLTGIEACLNSRPSLPLADDPEDFLIGEPLTAIPEPSLADLSASRLSRWQLAKQILQHFRKRWSREYLNSLQS
ncbi:uncharacterized protein LOC143363334 [Halictus rubicundus]|uniref:uncharacterized protein LOC143363334 n=1 Tax=Halictus rubicundus TaxID=77578 RepID=UPI0040373AF5